MIKTKILSIILGSFMASVFFAVNAYAFPVTLTVTAKNQSSTSDLSYNLQYESKNHYFTTTITKTFNEKSKSFTLLAYKNGTPNISNLLKTKNACFAGFSYSISENYNATLQFDQKSGEFCKNFKINLNPTSIDCNQKGCKIALTATIKD